MNIIRDISYRPMSSGVFGLGDLYLPDAISLKTRTAITIHGGGWSSLDRRSFAGIAEFFCRDLGMITFNIEYRLVCDTPWPACGDDCLAAVKFFRQTLLPQYLGNKIPHTFVIGASAGGHLALMTGLRMPPNEIGGIISISGISALEPDMEQWPERYELFFGRSPTEELIAHASPITYLSEISPPILCTHTRYDEVVSCNSAEQFIARAAAQGARIEYYFYERRDEGHCIWIPGSDPHKLYPDIEDAIKKFAFSLP